MEKFFLRLYFFRKELNIIHDEKVVLSILILEAVRRSRLHRIGVVDGKFLGRKIKHLSPRVLFLKVVSYRLDQVRFTASCVAVDEEGIIGDAGAGEYRLGGCVGEIIERTDHERVEGIARIQVVALVNVKFI